MHNINMKAQRTKPACVSQNAAFPQVQLLSAVRLHQQFPATFHIPSEAKRKSLRPGDFAKLIFEIQRDGQTITERMWVVIQSAFDNGEYIGELDNHSVSSPELCLGGAMFGFQHDHIIDIMRAADEVKQAA